MKVAIYRVFYGHDFIRKSVESVLPWADQVYIFWTDKPWMGSSESLPMQAWHDTRYECQTLTSLHPRVHLIEDHTASPRNQFTQQFNKHLLGRRIEKVMVMEPDMVWHPMQLAKMVETVGKSRGKHFRARAIELWKPPHVDRYHQIDERKSRVGGRPYILHVGDGPMPQTGLSGEPAIYVDLDCYVHNFGFCVSEKTMRLKHAAALQYSAMIGDSVPYAPWVDEVWMKWTPEMQDLEISVHHRAAIRHAYPYEGELPWSG